MVILGGNSSKQAGGTCISPACFIRINLDSRPSRPRALQTSIRDLRGKLKCRVMRQQRCINASQWIAWWIQDRREEIGPTDLH
ncbi:unnamed protein product [Penicillium pancosmium]